MGLTSKKACVYSLSLYFFLYLILVLYTKIYEKVFCLYQAVNVNINMYNFACLNMYKFNHFLY